MIRTKTQIVNPVRLFGPAGLVAYYPLSTESLFADYSGAGLHGTSPGTFGSRVGRQHPTLNFDGDLTSYIAINSSTINGEGKRSLSLWARLDTLNTGDTTLYSEGYGTAIRAKVVLSNAGAVTVTTYSGIGGSAVLTAPAGTIKTNQWFHLAFVQYLDFGNSLHRLYINGKLVSTVGTSITPYVANIGTIGAARSNMGATAQIDGAIEEVVLYKRTLAPAEIAAYYQEITGNTLTSKLWALTHFYSPILISEPLTLADTTAARAVVVGKSAADGLSVQDAVDAQAVYTKQINESVTLVDTLSPELGRIAQDDESLTVAETLAYQAEYQRSLSEGMAIADTVVAKAVYSPELSETLGLSDTVTHDRWWTVFSSIRLVNSIGDLVVWESQTLENAFAAGFFLATTWNRTALTLENSIQASPVFSSLALSSAIRNHAEIWKTQRLFNNIWGPSSTTQLHYEYQVLLDGIDVTAKTQSCTINYGEDKFCGDIDITWVDRSMYALVDTSNIAANYMLERVVVNTRIVGETGWLCQGRFYLEKRGTNVSYDKIDVTSWGRTKPALLDRPYATPVTRTWFTDTTALAIATEMAALGPVTLHWEIMDYKILGSNFSVDGSSPIDVISQLAAPVGGIVYSGKNAELHVVYPFRD